jgi:hypothetical protein
MLPNQNLPNGTSLTARSRCPFTGPKNVSISRAQLTPSCPRNGFAPHQKHYVRDRINHRSINSYYVFFFLRRPWPTVAFIDNRSSTVLTNINNFNNNTGKITLLCVGETFGTTVHIRLKRRHSFMTTHFRYKIIHSILFLQQNGKKTTLTNGDDLPLQDI